MKLIFKLMLITIVFNYSFSQCEGDANLDNTIDILDIVTVVNHALGNILLDGEAFDNAEIDGDNIINILDIVLIVDIVLNGNSECDTDFNPIDFGFKGRKFRKPIYLNKVVL